MKENKQIQALLDKYLAGETSNEEEETLRNYFEKHGDDIPEEWKSFRALFSFVGFEKAKRHSIRRYIAISIAAAVAIVLMVTGIFSITAHQRGEAQSECYAVIDGKVYTNPQKVHDEALDALQGIGCDGQDDAFEALDMMQ